MHSTKFQNLTFKWKTKIKLRTIQNIKEQKVCEYNNDSNNTKPNTKKQLHICVCTTTHTYILGMHISITEADAIRYIEDTYEAACNAMRYDTIHPYYDAVRFDFDSIQHNAIRCNTEKYMQWKKYGRFYFFEINILWKWFIIYGKFRKH